MSTVTVKRQAAGGMAKYDVTMGKTQCGVIFDEEGAIKSRGRFAAWSMKAKPVEGKPNNGIVGFFDTLEEAAEAIASLYRPKILPGTCRFAYAGEIHVTVEGVDGQPYALCRAAGRPPRYLSMVGPATCRTCVQLESDRTVVVSGA